MTISREVKLGALAIVAIAMVLFGISYLRNSSLFGSSLRLHTVYKDVVGLAPGAPVLLNGLAVGSVKEMQITPDGRSVLVSYELETEAQIPRDSRAVIVSPSLIGGKALSLAMGRSNQYVAKNDTLRDSIEVDIVARVSSQVEPLAAQVQVLAKQLNATLASLSASIDSNQLRRIVGNAESITVNLDRGTKNIDKITANTERLTAALARNEQNLDRILNNTAGVSDSLRTAMTDLKQTLHNTNQAMASINDITGSLKNGEGTVGKLLTDAELYDNLTQTTADLDKLLVELKERPGRFLSFSVFGRGDKE